MEAANIKLAHLLRGQAIVDGGLLADMCLQEVNTKG